MIPVIGGNVEFTSLLSGQLAAAAVKTGALGSAIGETISEIGDADYYKFHGSQGAQFKQIGNAVPPKLAKKIASALAVVLNGNENNLVDNLKKTDD